MPTGSTRTLDKRHQDETSTAENSPQSPTDDSPDPDGGQERRTTVNLSVLALAALSLISTLLGVNKTEAINRALRFYGEITQLLADGGAVYIREPGSKELERIKIY